MSLYHGKRRKVRAHLNRIFKLRDQGLSIPKIAKELRKNYAAIRYQIKTHKHEYPLKKVEIRKCQECGTTLIRVGQHKFCSHKCANEFGWTSERRWPKWITDERGNNIATGKTYAEYKRDADKR